MYKIFVDNAHILMYSLKKSKKFYKNSLYTTEC